MTEPKRQIVKLYLKNSYFYQGRYVTKDERFLHFIDRKTGKLKLLNLDEIREMHIEDEEVEE